MLRKLVEASLHFRLVVAGLALAIAALGAWSFVNLPIDAFPDISSTQVKIILKAPGMTPEEVESRVITPIEMEMLGIPNQTVLRSVAKYAIADITIDFADGTDIYWARSQVAERLANATADLPATVEGGMAPISTPLSDMFMFTIEGPLSLTEKRRLLDWTVRPALRTVPGVADVNALGGMVETYEVQPDGAALAAAGLTIEDLKAAIEASNRNDGAGRLSVAEESLIVRSVGAIASLDDLASVVVRSAGGAVVRVGDVATVRMGSLTRYGAVTKNGKGEAVQGLVIGLRGADASKIVAGIKQRLEELQPTLPPGVTIAPFYDRSDLIGRAVGTVEKALLEATVLVVILLLLFLGDVRASVIVALALPMAALMTFIWMRSIGLTANLMSLGGLAIAVGMLVDGAVVVVENVVERLSDPKHRGATKLNAVFVADVPEIEAVIARVGSDELGLDPMSPNETDSFLQLKPRDEWRRADKAWLTDQIRNVMHDFPGIEPTFTQPIEMRISEMLTGARGDLVIKLFGPDLKELSRLAGEIQGRLEKIEGTTEAMTVANDTVDYLQLDMDRVAAGRAGMPVDLLQDMMRANVEGVRAGTVTEAGRRVPVMIKGTGGAGMDPAQFADQLYRAPSGQLVRASDVAHVRQVAGPVKLEHENGSRYAMVQAFVGGRDLVGYVDDAKRDIEANVKLPQGYRLVWGGQFENQQRASARLMVVLPISLVLIYLVLYATLGSVRASLLILVNIPFAMVGGIISLALSGEYLSVPASVGFIALLGIAVLNGLVMVTCFRQLREDGLSLQQAVRQGAARRLRPVMMTATIAAFGLVPLLFATGPGSEIQRPLAIVVIGGLVSATMLTLILLPILYQRFGESRAERDAGALDTAAGEAA